MVQRDEFWFKFQETILFAHIGDVEQVNVIDICYMGIKDLNLCTTGLPTKTVTLVLAV
jgi:hypothetical protein